MSETARVAAFPVTLFFALKPSSMGLVPTRPKNAVIDAFPARQRRMESRSSGICYRIVTLYQEVDPQTHGANSAMDLQDALAEVAILQETVTQLTAILDAALLHPRLVCRLLLENGAEVSATGGKYGTALQAASVQGHVGSIQLLLQYGADVNTAGGVHGSALQAGSAKGCVEVVCLLLEHGAEVNAVGGPYGSALQAASRNDHIDAVQLLLQYGADVDATGGVHGSTLQAASRNGYINIVRLLLEKGTDIK
ncbi:ankyrin repeat-containing domain protein [Mycena olivaceomarginata]|nr:ankyrin repeat-containing domain protein [Mycena olivaceomarginata]